MTVSVKARFAIVGLVCAATHNVIVIAASWLHIHYALACALSYAVVVLLGFALHVRFTFQQQPSLAAFWRYAIGMAANYPITLALLFVMCDVAGWPVAIAAPAATTVMIVWNYLASRWAIVRPASPPQTANPGSL